MTRPAVALALVVVTLPALAGARPRPAGPACLGRRFAEARPDTTGSDGAFGYACFGAGGVEHCLRFDDQGAVAEAAADEIPPFSPAPPGVADRAGAGARDPVPLGDGRCGAAVPAESAVVIVDRAGAVTRRAVAAPAAWLEGAELVAAGRSLLLIGAGGERLVVPAAGDA